MGLIKIKEHSREAPVLEVRLNLHTFPHATAMMPSNSMPSHGSLEYPGFDESYTSIWLLTKGIMVDGGNLASVRNLSALESLVYREYRMVQDPPSNVRFGFRLPP